MALKIKELTEELENVIQERCRMSGIYVPISLCTGQVAIDVNKEIIIIPCGGRHDRDEPRLLVMLYGKEKSDILYEEYVCGCLVTDEVTQISGVPKGLEKNELYELISHYFECYEKDLNEGFLLYNPNSEPYQIKVLFDRCKIFGAE